MALLWSCGIARSHDKLKSLYLHYHSGYSHQTWQISDLSWGTSNNKVNYFDQIVLQSHVTNNNHYFSITRVPMATERGRMITYLYGLLPVKSHGPLITWPTLGHTTLWKNYISTITKPMDSKPGKVLTYGRFSTQML